ncbi:MAG: pentapeptide repeat-containing protein, partial [Methanosarcina mazei]|nr:pentapeptide repeat-containing protein [Methanosarcina mazei]
NLQGANLQGTDLYGANLQGANLQEANLYGADLQGAHHLSFDQLSKVKTLYDTKLDEEFLVPLKKKYPALFEKPNE